jgi:heat shock protein HslJ
VKKTTYIALAALLMMVTMLSCGVVDRIEKEDLVGTIWEWTTLTARLPWNRIEVPDPEDYTLEFTTDNRVLVQADCNDVVGTYVLRRDTLIIELGPSTLADCGEDSLDMEFLDALDQVDNIDIDRTGLVLGLEESPSTMRFDHGGPVAPPTQPPVQPTATLPPKPTQPQPTQPPPPTATPLPSPTPGAQISFWADSTQLAQGECTNLNWRVENVDSVWVYPKGERYEDYPVTGHGKQRVCPDETTTYMMRVLLTDGSVQTREVTILVEPGNPLADTAWVLVSMHGMTPLLPSTEITARFDGDDALSGSGGCNTYSASYQVSGPEMRIQDLTATRQLCGEEIDEQESTYFRALEASSTYSFDGSQLVIQAPSGTEILRYNPSR